MSKATKTKSIALDSQLKKAVAKECKCTQKFVAEIHALLLSRDLKALKALEGKKQMQARGILYLLKQQSALKSTKALDTWMTSRNGAQTRKGDSDAINKIFTHAQTTDQQNNLTAEAQRTFKKLKESVDEYNSEVLNYETSEYVHTLSNFYGMIARLPDTLHDDWLAINNINKGNKMCYFSPKLM